MKLKYVAVLAFSFIGNACFSQETIKQDGYFNLTEVGFIKGISASYSEDIENDVPNAGSIRTINGVFLSSEWSVGIGIGLDGYSQQHDASIVREYYNTAPVFLDARYYIHESRNTPFVFTDIGYSLKFGNNFDKGLMIGIGGGYKFFIGDKTCLVAGLGYNLQQIQDVAYATSGKLNLHSASLHLGFLF